MAQNVNPADGFGMNKEDSPVPEGTQLPSSMAETGRPIVDRVTAIPSVGRTRLQGNDNKNGTHSVTKRLQHELLTLMTCGDKGISAFPDTDYMFKWTGTIHGPVGTVYEGVIYKLSLEFPSGYPYSPPTVRFVTQCFHPNVDQMSGTICLDILKDKWSALYDVRAVLLSIQSLLGEPNNESPLNPAASDLWSNEPVFRQKVKEKARLTTTTINV